MFARARIPVKRSHLTSHEVDDETLVYDPQRRATHRLNGTARYIWERCDGKHTCRSIADGMVQVWDVAQDEATADVEAAVKQMVRQKLVNWRPATES